VTRIIIIICNDFTETIILYQYLNYSGDD